MKDLFIVTGIFLSTFTPLYLLFSWMVDRFFQDEDTNDSELGDYE